MTLCPCCAIEIAADDDRTVPLPPFEEAIKPTPKTIAVVPSKPIRPVLPPADPKNDVVLAPTPSVIVPASSISSLVVPKPPAAPKELPPPADQKKPVASKPVAAPIKNEPTPLTIPMPELLLPDDASDPTNTNGRTRQQRTMDRIRRERGNSRRGRSSSFTTSTQNS